MIGIVKLEEETKPEKDASHPVGVDLIAGPDNFLRIHRNLHTGMWRAKCMNGFSKAAMQIPTKFTPVRDIKSFFRRQGLQWMKKQVFLVSKEIMDQQSHLATKEVSESEDAILFKNANRGECRLMLSGGIEACVFATTEVKQHEIVGLYASEVVESVPESAVFDRSHMWVIELEGSNPSVCFSCMRGGSIFRWMRHSSQVGHWRDANVKLAVVWRKKLPFLVVRAIVDIEAGSELLYDWTEDFLSDLRMFDLNNISVASHSLHVYLQKLQRTCLEHGISLPEWRWDSPWQMDVLASKTEARIVTATHGFVFRRNFVMEQKQEKDEEENDANEDVFLGIEFAPKQALFHSSFGRTVEEMLAFPRSKIWYLEKQAITEKAQAELKRLIKHSPNKLPKSWEVLFPPEYHDRIGKLIDTSYTGGSVEVRQITSLSNSVRWMNVPSRPQFGVFAMRDLPKGYPILCYKGLLCHGRTEASSAVHWTSNYCVNAEEGINLAVDCARMGNEARFINDHLGSGRSKNSEYVWCFCPRRQQMFLIIKLSRNVSKGDEVLCTYGGDFWGVALDAQLAEHIKYLWATIPRTKQLELELRKAGAEVPQVDSLSAGSLDGFCRKGQLFECAAGSYPSTLLDKFAEIDSVPLAPECVLRHKGDLFLVKFRGLDLSWSEWLHKDTPDIQHLIERYKEKVSRGEKVHQNVKVSWAGEFAAMAAVNNVVIIKPKKFRDD